MGGNPWNGSKANVYGWASWNGTKSTLALRNGAAAQQQFTTTLREALDIPASVKGSIVLRKSFKEQVTLKGLKEGEPIDIDTRLTLTLPASSLYVFDGLDSEVETAVKAVEPSARRDGTNALYDLQGRQLSANQQPAQGLYISNGRVFAPTN